jgi:hypothetical protein
MRKNRGVFSSAPRIGFWPTRINAREMTRSFFARSSDLGTAFHSPAATVPFREPPRQDRCSWPIPSIQLRTSPQARSVWNSLPLPHCAERGRSALPARCPIQDPKFPDVHRLPLPSGSFHSLGLKALYRRQSLGKLTLADSPIFLRSPTAPIIANVLAAGSSFRIRYRPPGSLPSEPLGTILIMDPKRFGVNH